MSNLWTLARQHTPEGVLTPGETLPEMFGHAVERRADRVWLRQKERGFWRTWSWRRAGVAVREAAMGLAAIGLQPGERCSILANTRIEWLLADLGVLCAGGVSSGIYPTDSAEQVQYLCEDSDSVVLFVEDDEQFDKALAVRARLPKLRWIVVFDTDGLEPLDDPAVLSWGELLRRGRDHDAAHLGEHALRQAARGAQDLAILVYTSGTTGRPKGAMHSHGGLVYSARHFTRTLPQSEADERMCFLPLCHLAERLGGAYVSIYSGAVLNFVENPETVPENVREIAPTVFFAVPRVWEKFHSAAVIALKEATPLQRLTYDWAIGIGERVADKVIAGQPVPALLKLAFRLAHWLALDNVRRFIGIHRARRLVTGAAPISPALIRWYLALGVPMLEGWAQTECPLGTFTSPERIRPGTIGRAADGVEVRIDPATGELLLRGPAVFIGYLNQPEKTAETIGPDGWLHTGDVGRVDDEGNFRITDRMKDIIITAGGKNITPSEIENELKFSPYITDAVVIGDRRPYLTAIVMIDQDNVERWAQEQAVPFSNFASLARAPEVNALVRAHIDAVNRKFARVEQIKSFFVLETRLSAEDEEVTPTMKLKRKFVEKKYADRIEAMYA